MRRDTIISTTTVFSACGQEVCCWATADRRECKARAIQYGVGLAVKDSICHKSEYSNSEFFDERLYNVYALQDD